MTQLHTILDMRRRQELALDRAEHPDPYQRWFHQMLEINERGLEALIDSTLISGAMPGEFGIVAVFRRGDFGYLQPRLV